MYTYRGEQVHILSAMEELLPSIGTSVPSPSVRAVVICQSDSILQNVGKLCSDVHHSHSPDADGEAEVDIDTPFDFYDESFHVPKTHLISISDDGKVWNWLVTAEHAEDTQKDDTGVSMSTDVGEVPASDSNTDQMVSSSNTLTSEAGKQLDSANTSGGRPPSDLSKLDLSFKVCQRFYNSSSFLACVCHLIVIVVSGSNIGCYISYIPISYVFFQHSNPKLFASCTYS